MGFALLGSGIAAAQSANQPAANQPAANQARVNASVVRAIGVKDRLAQLTALQKRGEGDSNTALRLRDQVLQAVMLASFDVDETLARIDAEAAHASDSQAVLRAQKERRNTQLDIATFVIGGVLSTAGSAMQLTRGLDHAGNALNVAGGASTITLSIVQLSGRGNKRLLLSPYNMLAEVLDQKPNAQSHYPAVVKAYLSAPFAQDGQLPDEAPPSDSLQKTWYRLHLLQSGGSHEGASLQSATTDSTTGLRLTETELQDREAMLRDLHGAVALLKTDLRGVLLLLNASPEHDVGPDVQP